jgi:hypothetical protein
VLDDDRSRGVWVGQGWEVQVELKRRSLRGAALYDVQDLIEKAIQELESVDALTRDKGR